MRAMDIINALYASPGCTRKIHVRASVESLKAFQHMHVEKDQILYVSAGTDFSNRRDIKEAIEAGERGEVEPLPWGVWQWHHWIIVHTPKGSLEVVEYVRFYPPSDRQEAAFDFSPVIQFYANGVAIDRETAILYCGSKAQPKPVKPGCFSIRASNIVEVL